MRARWIRNEPDRQENVGAGIVGAAVAMGVGLAVFYVTRLLMAREPLSGGALPAPRGGADGARVEEA